MTTRTSSYLRAIDHVHYAFPPGGGAEQSRFLIEVLGMEQIVRPSGSAHEGGWFQGGGVQIHTGADPDFHPAKKAHVALVCGEYDALLMNLEAKGIPYSSEDRGRTRRCVLHDPFGNKIELVAAEG